MGIFFFALVIPGIIIIIEFIYYMLSGMRFLGSTLQKIFDIVILVVLPFIYLRLQDYGAKNDCCNDIVLFSPEHRLIIYTIIIICLATYFYCSYRRKIASPVVEVAVNAILMAGIVLNIFISIQIQDAGFIILGNVPIIITFIFIVMKNQQLLSYHIQNFLYEKRTLANFFLRLLQLDIRLKIPLFLVICLPVLFIIGSILLLFGQQPDSIIKAFTDTYHHGFSQLDYLCENVDCGGHYLCSVAANGHKKMVKPQRLGMRGGHLIICNRQLLVSNAFEELLEQKIPFIHKHIRKNYDRVGDLVHRYYWVFNIKWVSDVIYLLMKPAEWFFLLILYTFDRKPEDRIARQYLSKQDRQLIAASQRINK